MSEQRRRANDRHDIGSKLLAKAVIKKLGKFWGIPGIPCDSSLFQVIDVMSLLLNLVDLCWALVATCGSNGAYAFFKIVFQFIYGHMCISHKHFQQHLRHSI